MPKKPKLDIAKFHKFITKQRVRNPRSRTALVDSTYRLAIAVLGKQLFYKKLGKEERKRLRELLLELEEAEHKLQSSERDLVDQFVQGKISGAEYRKKARVSTASFKQHMVLEELNDFCKKNNVPTRVFDEFLDKVNRTMNEIMQRFSQG